MKYDSIIINNEFNELIHNIPVDQANKLSYKQMYDDIICTLFVENDVNGFKHKCVENKKLIEKHNHKKHENCHCVDSTIYYSIFYDLYLSSLSESLRSSFSIAVNSSLIERINEYLSLYERTNDIYYYEQAKTLLNEIYNSSGSYRTSEGITDLERFIQILESNTDFPEEYNEQINFLKKYINRHHLHASLNEVCCEKDLENFIIYFLKYEAPHGEATADMIINELKNKGLLNPCYKLNARMIGRGVLSDRPWFKGTKKYDPQSQQELKFWRYEQ